MNRFFAIHGDAGGSEFLFALLFQMSLLFRSSIRSVSYFPDSSSSPLIHSLVFNS